VVLARLLSPNDFGVYAVALTVQVILITLTELGVSADLIRRGQITERGPTAATIGLGVSAFMALCMAALAQPLASLLGSDEAAPVMRVMAVTLVLSGLSVVPYSIMQREFMQSRQLLIDAVGLVVSTMVTVGLILIGTGPMSLAVGRVVAQASTVVLQFWITKSRPKFGWDASIARQMTAFGAPIAAANLLSWVILSFDNMLVGHNLGATALGFYVLAFNLSSWPMNALGLTIRSVALPAFSRLRDDGPDTQRAFQTSTSLICLLAVPLSTLLIAFAGPLIRFLYGERWMPSASILAALGAFGCLRILFDMFASFLYSRGKSRTVLMVQVLWLVALIPAMWLGIQEWGLVGAGWAHVVVGVGILLPAYLVALRSARVAWQTVLVSPIWPVLACVPAAVAALAMTSRLDSAPAIVLVGGLTFSLVYGIGVWPLVRRMQQRTGGLFGAAGGKPRIGRTDGPNHGK
jgi:PST family polysaccharide transporter